MAEDQAESQIVRVHDHARSTAIGPLKSSLAARGYQDAASIVRQASLVRDQISALRLRASEGDRNAQYELGVALRTGYLQEEEVGSSDCGGPLS